jgi:hypothetical protein
MRVTEVQALVKYATEMQGSWVTIELGSTASLTTNDETLESVSDELYQRLTKQLKVLWASNKAGGDETQRGTQAETQNLNPHWCTQHQVEFRKFSKDGNSWFSHKTADGTWHNRGN